ncbi:alpha/beta fold hydrolase [Spirulina subsalsa FACHB-351]|uniref:Alpha/beta fold hydrolase n=1 Tax=Spirulina subsalsa FACHB-351 TaxID=234711 RepID=A0ABT3LCY0_9CYAN|nr:alpha/beta fold hydrolase [Spirulina subsalsa]MCW6038997.1 alpha/beta fold hydrolase [Spirulina subsalsa FACHB-351]
MVAIQTTNTLGNLEKHPWIWQGYKICYTVQGEGQPLVLIHGFGASVGHWRKNIPVLAAQGYRVFALDLLGFGDSEKPVLDYTLELWEQQLGDFWQEFIQVPTVWVGNSIGGLLSLMLLTDHPEMGRGGVLINCAGGLNHRPDELNFPLRVIMGTFTKVVNSQITGPFLFNMIRQKSRIRNTLYQVYCDRTAVTDELVEMLYRPSCDPNAQKVFASILSAPPGPSPQALLPHLNHPLLVLWGENDPWTPIQGAKIYQQLAECQDSVTFHSIPRAGHCPHDEKPEQVNQFISQWLQELPES